MCVQVGGWVAIGADRSGVGRRLEDSMNITALWSHARIFGTFAATGVTALVSTLAVAGSAATAGSLGSGADDSRITVTGEAYCNDDMPVGIDFAYDDHVDGHVPTAVHEQISDHTGVRWTRDELHQQNGDYFNTYFYPESANESQWIEPNATYTYTVTITYDDGVTQSADTSVSLINACAAAPASTSAAPPETTQPPTTTAVPPSTTLPATDITLENHPLVGAWLLVNESDPTGQPLLVAFTSDGIVQQTDADGIAGFGTWEPIGPASAGLTVLQLIPDSAGTPATVTIHASIQVAPDGQSFTADYTLELAEGDLPPGQYGPGSASATRIEVEPMGTPAGSLDELFAEIGEGTLPATTTPS
jgi:hypothetical protein